MKRFLLRLANFYLLTMLASSWLTKYVPEVSVLIGVGIIVIVTGLIGFIIFRILDISKPFPIRTLEKHLPGGLGIVADDVVAGIMANLLLRVIIHFI